MMTFTQLIARLKNISRGWLLALDIKETLVECATVCVKSEVILICVYFCMLSTAILHAGQRWLQSIVAHYECMNYYSIRTH